MSDLQCALLSWIAAATVDTAALEWMAENVVRHLFQVEGVHVSAVFLSDLDLRQRGILVCQAGILVDAGHHY